jgi:DNA-nicking Smr family endonuclease
LKEPRGCHYDDACKTRLHNDLQLEEAMMDFKEIFEAWEKQRAGKSSSGRHDMQDLISRYPPKEPKEEHEPLNQKRPSSAARNLRNLEPQATVDLHGMNSRQAEQALDDFVLQCRRRGLRKILVVHGKGHHSQGEPVLQSVVRRYLEKSPHTGAFGPAERRHGGRGATWVVVRQAG